jgi:prepilin-type N-terminal cleavage/methylation domain-containing protein
MTARRGERGFTLLELTIAMAIAGLVAAGIATLATYSLEATERGDRLAESIQTARHLADRIDRLLATADPTAVTWSAGVEWSPWIQAGRPGETPTRLDWVEGWAGRVVETRGAASETLTGMAADESEGASVQQLFFRPLVRTRDGVRYVVRVEVLMTVEPRDARGASGRAHWRWHAPVVAGAERFQ